MKTLPSIPKSIPAHILEQVKAKGLIYVGEGVGDKSPIFGEKGEDSHYCVPYEFGAGLQYGGTMSGDGKGWHYFVTPAIAAKYFTIPKKTTQVLTRGAKGRFISPKPVPVVKYPDVKKVAAWYNLPDSIRECDQVLHGAFSSIRRAFDWQTATPSGADTTYWNVRDDGNPKLSSADLDFIRAIRDEFKARLALEEKTKAEAAAKAKREEEEKKSRLPKIGEVWHAAFTNEDYLVSRVSSSDALLISLADGNRLDDVRTKYHLGALLAFPPNYGPFTFVAASPAEYFKNNP